MKRIPMCEPQLYGDEWKLVKECFDTNWISSKGRFVEEFEGLFAEFCGRKHAVAVTSGSTALHLALAALDIGPGHEVIVPALTIVSCPNAVHQQGAAVRVADVQPDTWNIDPDDIRRKLTDRTKAILVVHTYGCPADMEAIEDICRQYDLMLIEDAAEAHGAIYKGRRTGSFGDVSCFSFYANKIVTTGEGGMLLTDDDDLARKIRRMKDLSFIPERRFYHLEFGFNYRMTNIQAAVGVAQMAHVEESIRCRRRNAVLYDERLKAIPGLRPPFVPPETESVYWYYSVVVEDDFSISRDKLVLHLERHGIESRNFFYPIHKQPIYPHLKDEVCPVAESLGARGINLPSGNTLKEDEIDYVTECIKNIGKG